MATLWLYRDALEYSVPAWINRVLAVLFMAIAMFLAWREEKEKMVDATKRSNKFWDRLQAQGVEVAALQEKHAALWSENADLKNKVSKMESQRATQRECILRKCRDVILKGNSARVAVHLAGADELESNDDLVWVCDKLVEHHHNHPFWSFIPTQIIGDDPLEKANFDGFLRPQEDWLPFLKRMRLSPFAVENDHAYAEFTLLDQERAVDSPK